MNTLYIANKTYSSWSLRPWVLMKHLGILFDEELVPFVTGGSNRDKFLAYSPSGKLPCLHTPDGVVWDSLAITEHLADTYPEVWPRDRRERAWARSAAAEMHTGFGRLRQVCSMNCCIEVRLHQIDAALQADLDRLQALWNEGLERFGGPFLAGDTFTAVDAFFCPVAFRVRAYGLPLDEPCMAYVDRLLALPAMQEWQREALAEAWVEPDHEAACLAHGTLIRDRRPGR